MSKGKGKQLVIKLTTNYIQLARVTMSYHELLTRKEKSDRTHSYPLMSVVVIELSNNLVQKILYQDNGKIMRTWGGSRRTWVTKQQRFHWS